MDEEETVVLPNSPLHTYLRDESCCQDEDIQDLLTEQIVRTPSKILSYDNFSTGRLKMAFSTFLYSVVARIRNFAGLYNTERNFDRKCKFIRLLLNANMLDEDDCVILDAECDDLKEERLKLRLYLDKNVGGNGEFLFSNWIKISAVILFVAILCALFHFDCGSSSLWFFMAIFIGYAALKIIFVTFYAFRERRWTKLFVNVAEFIDEQRKVDDALRRALKFLREREVIGRGYTVVTKYTVIASACTKFRNDSSSTAFALDLRRIVNETARKIFFLFQNYALLINRIARMSTHENVEPFLLASSKEFNNVFTDSEDPKDYLSLTSLRARCYCLSLQRSEFLRFFAMMRQWQIPDYRILLSFKTETMEMRNVLERKLSFFTTLDNTKPAEGGVRTRKCVSESSNPLFDHVHSLGLHLRTALERNLDFEKMVIKDSTVESQIPVGVHIEEMAEILKKCQACLDEMTIMLKKDEKSHHDDAKNNIEAIEKEHDSSGQTSISPPLMELFQAEVVDKVYEATADGYEYYNGRLSNDDLFSPDSEAKFLQSGRRNLLDELKSVLSVRSTLTRERETKALAAQRGVDVEQILMEEKSMEAENSKNDSMENRNFCENHENGPKISHNFPSELSRAIQAKAATFFINKCVDFVDESESSED